MVKHVYARTIPKIYASGSSRKRLWSISTARAGFSCLTLCQFIHLSSLTPFCVPYLRKYCRTSVLKCRWGVMQAANCQNFCMLRQFDHDNVRWQKEATRMAKGSKETVHISRVNL